MQAAICLLLILTSPFVAAFAQTTEISGEVNIYVPVTAVDRCANSITVESAAGFAVGDRVLLIQMKGVAIDTTNTPEFGRILDYGNVGHYEFATIGAINGLQIIFRYNLLQTYDTEGSLQLVRVPVYEDADVVGALSAPAWNGRTGGVLALDVTGTLSLHADIDMTGAGFRGGAANILQDNGECGQIFFFVDRATGLAGEKGEGIGVTLPDSFSAGRGAVASGGGGGNPKNSGGGGGANGGAGGHGGAQWLNCPLEADTVINTGGFGGYRPDSNVVVGRIFLGGGGGGGHEDNLSSTDGTVGGGIIIIRAGVVDGNSHRIVADGVPALPAGFDGGGGGGAGGSILFDVDTLLSPLSLRAVGAVGADTRHIPEFHGPGGGGGGGVVGVGQSSIPSLLSVDASGGAAGRIFSPDSNYGATAGEKGVVVTGLHIPEGDVLFRMPQASIELPMIVADPGDTISIPLMFSTAENLGFSGATGYRLSIRFNRHLLRPIGSTPPGTIVGDDRIYELDGPIPDSAIVPAVYRFLVLLGPVDTTSLTIDAFTWEGDILCPIDLLWQRNGFLTVNTCRTGDSRLVGSGSEAMLRAVYPNPAISTVEIDYTLLEDGPTRISLVDLTGREVALLRNDIGSPGSYSLTFDTSPLPDGVYLCLLQTPTERFSVAVHIQR